MTDAGCNRKRATLPGSLVGSCGILLSLMLALCSQSALAVTLGTETVLSWLGDPVEVEIDVLQWEDLDFENTEIRVASPGEYEAFDLTYLDILRDLNFNLVGPNIDGKVRILISTREPATEPYIELLLVMRWPGGSLLREYVLLFDLPESAPVSSTVPAPLQTVPAPVTNTSQVVTVTTAQTRPQPQPDPEPQPATQPEMQLPNVRTEPAVTLEPVTPRAQQPGPSTTGRRSYQVREGDILWNIAQQFVPAGSGENLYQMLLSMHALNNASFINGNITLLKAGSLLQIPSAEDMESIDAATAQADFEQLWEEGSRRLQMANQGELPDFSPLGDQMEEPAPAIEIVEPDNEAGVETGARSQQSNGPLLPENTTVVVPLTGQNQSTGMLALQAQEPLVPPVTETRDEGLSDSNSRAGEPAPYNPYLERVNQSARNAQQLLQSRALQITRLENDMVAVRQSLREAQEVVSEVNAALAQALAHRSEQNNSYRRNTTLLASFALALLVALVLACVMVLKLAAQLRSQRRLLQADLLAEEDIMRFSATRPETASNATHAMREKPDLSGAGMIVEELVPQEAPDMSEDDNAVSKANELQQELMDFLGTPGAEHEADKNPDKPA